MTERPLTWSACSWVMMMALRVGGVFIDQAHAAEEFAATETCVDEDARAPGSENGGVAFGTGCEHGEADHELRIDDLGSEG